MQKYFYHISNLINVRYTDNGVLYPIGANSIRTIGSDLASGMCSFTFGNGDDEASSFSIVGKNDNQVCQFAFLFYIFVIFLEDAFLSSLADPAGWTYLASVYSEKSIQTKNGKIAIYNILSIRIL